MKIENDLWASGAIAFKKNVSNNVGGTSFSEILAQTEQQQKNTQVSQVEMSPALIWEQPQAAAQSPILGNLEDMLGTLEQYGQALADPKRTLKQLEPLTKDLDRKLTEMEDQLTGQVPEDLRELAEQTLTLAKVELMKFQRGDYI